jgi:hypothetical protein
MRERLWMWVAWRLPRRLVYWASIRLMSTATCGAYSDRTPTEVNIMEALHAWDG